MTIHLMIQGAHAFLFAKERVPSFKIYVDPEKLH